MVIELSEAVNNNDRHLRGRWRMQTLQTGPVVTRQRNHAAYAVSPRNTVYLRSICDIRAYIWILLCVNGVKLTRFCFLFSAESLDLCFSPHLSRTPFCPLVRVQRHHGTVFFLLDIKNIALTSPSLNLLDLTCRPCGPR